MLEMHEANTRGAKVADHAHVRRHLAVRDGRTTSRSFAVEIVNAMHGIGSTVQDQAAIRGDFYRPDAERRFDLIPLVSMRFKHGGHHGVEIRVGHAAPKVRIGEIAFTRDLDGLPGSDENRAGHPHNFFPLVVQDGVDHPNASAMRAVVGNPRFRLDMSHMCVDPRRRDINTRSAEIHHVDVDSVDRHE